MPGVDRDRRKGVEVFGKPISGTATTARRRSGSRRGAASCPAGTAHREAAMTDDLGRDALAHLALGLRIDRQDEVGMRLDVDKAGRYRQPLGVDDAAGLARQAGAMRAMRPFSIAKSARSPAAPLPSMTVPPRTRMSHIVSTPPANPVSTANQQALAASAGEHTDEDANKIGTSPPPVNPVVPTASASTSNFRFSRQAPEACGSAARPVLSQTGTSARSCRTAPPRSSWAGSVPVEPAASASAYGRPGVLRPRSCGPAPHAMAGGLRRTEQHRARTCFHGRGLRTPLVSLPFHVRDTR